VFGLGEGLVVRGGLEWFGLLWLGVISVDFGYFEDVLLLLVQWGLHIDELSIKRKHPALNNLLTVFTVPFSHNNIPEAYNLLLFLINDSQSVPRFNQVKANHFIDIDDKQSIGSVSLELLVLALLFQLLFLNELLLLWLCKRLDLDLEDKR
jgi:hypothetical protein